MGSHNHGWSEEELKRIPNQNNDKKRLLQIQTVEEATLNGNLEENDRNAMINIIVPATDVMVKY